MEVAIENGAQDIKEEEEVIEILSKPEDFETLREAMNKLEIEMAVCDLVMLPENFTNLDAPQGEAFQRFVSVFEDHDDVQNVYHNGEWE